jgi:acetoin utilization deacetylase AcuC-like enzyme
MIYTHRSFLGHDTGPGHPESPARLQTLFDLFAEKNWPVIQAHEAEIEWIARAHSMAYIDTLQDVMPDRASVFLDGDTIISPGTWEAAIHAAGAVCHAVEDIIAGKIKRAFCAVRPPGHHAEPAQAMGFCLFNNIFVGALHAQSLGLKRIAIVDFDVHHGNGNDTMARLHDNVFYTSTHQWPLFPGTGGPDDQISGRILNVPLPAGTDSQTFRAVYEKTIFPALHDFKPDLLMISAGFDAHRNDPLAQMNLDEDDFKWITRELCAIADTHTGGRVVSVLEGGYNLQALKRSVECHILSLCEQALPDAENYGSGDLSR